MKKEIFEKYQKRMYTGCFKRMIIRMIIALLASVGVLGGSFALWWFNTTEDILYFLVYALILIMIVVTPIFVFCLDESKRDFTKTRRTLERLKRNNVITEE